MEDSETIGPAARPRWSIVPPVLAGVLAIWIFYAAGYIFPALWEWQLTGVVAIVVMGALAGWISPRGRQLLIFGVLAGIAGLLTLVRGSAWFYYSLLFVPVVLALRWGALGIGYTGGLFLRRFQVGRWTMLAVLGCVVFTEIGWLLARDGYLLIRYARPRRVAFNDTDPGWFFLSPGQRAAGLTYVAVQRKATDPARARGIFAKALYAASEIPAESHMVLVGIAMGQVKAGFFEDAEATIRCIRDPIQFDLYYGVIAAEIAKYGGRSHAQRLFDQAVAAAQKHPEQSKRDRDLYLIGYRQWETGMHKEARETAELIQDADSKADLLDRLNDSAQLEIARQQAGSGRFNEAEATIRQNVKDPYRYCDGLISIATAAATNAQPDQARRIFDHALKSARQIDSPMGSDGVMAEIAVRELELGFQADSQQVLALVNHPGIRTELLQKLARLKPLAANHN